MIIVSLPFEANREDRGTTLQTKLLTQQSCASINANNLNTVIHTASTVPKSPKQIYIFFARLKQDFYYSYYCFHFSYYFYFYNKL